MSIKRLIREDTRRAILRALALDRGYSLNHRILVRVVEQTTAVTLSDDEMVAHLAWLEDQDAVATEVSPPYTLARLTDRGLQIAEGRLVIDGVSRPPPGHV